MMKKTIRSLSCLLLAAVMALGLCTGAFAAELPTLVSDTARYVYQTVSKPIVGSVGGEWAVLGLARSGYRVPDSYYQAYYAAVEQYVRDCGGVLHRKKYTEYSRVITALSAIGKDTRNVAGYDLTKPLGDYDKTVWQGLNGPIWALIALDSADYPMPVDPEAETQATRQMYVDRILDCQLADGGWSLNSADSADPDMTGMALQALAKYQDQPRVAQAVAQALDCISALQNSDGGFSSWGTANAESVVQVIVALCELGISPDDSRFVKNGNTLLDNLLTFRKSSGGFCHTADGGVDPMATEQALYGLAAVMRAETGANSLYRMGDAIQTAQTVPKTGQLPVTNPGKTFADIQSHEDRTAIEALAARGVINGKSDTGFDPDANMTRAEFAAIVVRALGLTPKAASDFPDVAADAWYAPYIGTASACGIVNGVGGGKFVPSGTITRQEATAMVARAAKLCGLETARSTAAVRDTLAQFSDYTKTAEWARESLAFCYDTGILDDSALTIDGTTAIRRCEIARMLYNLLTLAERL